MVDLDSTTLRVVDIIDGTTVDGPGFRTSIYFAGCTHHCPGCQNMHTWNPESGVDMTIRELLTRINKNDFNVTFSGGDPLFQIRPLTVLAKEIAAMGKNIWCYTGYDYETIVANSEFAELLRYIDVLVDGRFIDALRDLTLLFRGSSNQRLIDVKNSTTECVKEWISPF